MSQNTRFDFCVCGNGMVGSVVAIALAQRGFSVAWLAPEELVPFTHDDLPDVRVSAIALGSVRLLQSLGVWQAIAAMRIKPYTQLSVWENEGAATQFSAEQINESELGYFVENRIIQLACAQKSREYANLTVYKGSIAALYQRTDSVYLTLDTDSSIASRWVIGAEGANSKVRQQSGIANIAWQYEQQALGIIVELEGPSIGHTWQQFFSSGPRAFLPMYDNFAALIWYDSPQQLARLAQLSDEQLQQAIIEHFPERLAKIKGIVNKAQFPLTRMHANEYVKERTILVGDAAHTVNPLAGQGVNMGFSDIIALLAVVDAQAQHGVSSSQLISGLQQALNVQQKRRNTAMMSALEVIYHTFKQSSGPIKMLRNLGLLLADKSGPLKHQVIRFAAGLESIK